jgi:hypothetical protein
VLKWGAVSALACVGWLWGSGAQAANTAKPRVSPSFLGGSCVQTIERGSALHFDLGIPYEDAALTPDEPADSRTFQFFALCRDPGPLEELPLWIDGDDVVRAQEVNATIEDPAPNEVLQTAAAWDVPGHDGANGSCVVAMTGEAERMPITCAATTEGFDWDGAAAPVGSYVVYGYTFEPDQNLWTARGGVVRVVEPGAPEDAGPAVAFSFPLSDVDASFEGGVVVKGCIAAAEGTTLSVDWATAPTLDAEGDAAWQALPEPSVEAGVFEVAFVPEPQAEYKAVFFRARAEDPAGRVFVAYTHHPAIVVPGCAEPHGGHFPTIDSCGVGVPGDWSAPPTSAVDCEGTGDDTTADASATDGATTADSDDDGTAAVGTGESDGADEGCGCQSGAVPRLLGLLCVLLAVGSIRRSPAR